MVFHTELPDDRRHEKAIQGRAQDVAVGCWYTADGKMTIQILKYENEDGIITTVDKIRTLSQEKGLYGGVPMFRLKCVAEIEGTEYPFTLVFMTDTQRWQIIWQGRG